MLALPLTMPLLGVSVVYVVVVATVAILSRVLLYALVVVTLSRLLLLNYHTSTVVHAVVDVVIGVIYIYICVVMLVLLVCIVCVLTGYMRCVGCGVGFGGVDAVYVAVIGVNMGVHACCWRTRLRCCLGVLGCLVMLLLIICMLLFILIVLVLVLCFRGCFYM